jgi:hypothetical protein
MGLDAQGNFISEPHPADAPFPPQTGVPVTRGTGAPDGSTPVSSIYIDESTGDVYSNPTLTAGAWVLVGAAGTAANISGVGSPVGSVTPDALNQFYRRTDVDELYQAKGLTSADWVQWI